MRLFSRGGPTKALAGAPYVQQATSVHFGTFWPVLITSAMVLFAFTTLIGNLFYVENCIAYLNGGDVPSVGVMKVIHIIEALVIFLGAGLSMGTVWTVADVAMAFMCLINIPSCIALGGVSLRAMKDYAKQKDASKSPVFKAADIGLDADNLDFWQ